MDRVYYKAQISAFIAEPIDSVLGKLLINDEFETTEKQKKAWKTEIEILKDQLSPFTEGELAFEYTIPRLGRRIDVVCIVDGIIFLLEFKVSDNEFKKSTDDQVMNYALDLKYFHQESEKRLLIPINVSTKAEANENEPVEEMKDRITKVLHCNERSLMTTMLRVLSGRQEDPLTIAAWIDSKYVPTPTIIEAAQYIYQNHSVDEIARHDAGAYNLTQTTERLNSIIDNCKAEHRKAICFVTGVPGAGKTLVGLNIAINREQIDTNEHAVYLSGNGPLVDVLTEALKRDKKERSKLIRKQECAAPDEMTTFIQMVHRFRNEALESGSTPLCEKVIVFDEAQRAWDKAQLSKFMNEKRGIDDFDQSEPEFIIKTMDRNPDWAVIVCLVGGGQEIYTGEAGIQEWFYALRSMFANWEIYLSDKMTDSEYIGDSSLPVLLEGRAYHIEPELHLGVSLRSFRSENLSAFVKAVLDNRPDDARKLYTEELKAYPLCMTRDLEKAKEWVRNQARGTERFGLLASSEGKRLRGQGIWVPTTINHVAWFLNGKDHVDSSYYLEVAASEFKVQGLEIDYGIVAWDADFRFINDDFDYYRFRGTKWQHIYDDQRRRYLKNAYRVLLTRSRQGMIIYIPKGTDESLDATRASKYYDETYQYLLSCGILPIDIENPS